MSKKRTLEEDVNLFLNNWTWQANTALMGELAELFKIYDVEDRESDEDVYNFRLMRTVFLVSRLADFYAGKFLRLKSEFPGLWKRMQQEVQDGQEDQETTERHEEAS